MAGWLLGDLSYADVVNAFVCLLFSYLFSSSFVCLLNRVM